MKYYLITLNINSGWHETCMERLIKGRSSETVQQRADRICAKWWDEPDEFTPEVRAGTAREIPKEHYQIMLRYIDEL